MPVRRLLAVPDEDFEADRTGRQPFCQPAGLGPAFGPQPMVDAERTNPAIAAPRPLIGKDRQSEAVGSARDRDSDKRRGFEQGQAVEPVGELGDAERYRA